MLLSVNLILFLIAVSGSFPFIKGSTKREKKFLDKNPWLKEPSPYVAKIVRILPVPFVDAIPFAKSKEEKMITGDPILIDDKPDPPKKKIINTINEAEAEKLLVEKLEISKSDMSSKQRVALLANSDPMCNDFERERKKYCDSAKEIVANLSFAFEEMGAAPYKCEIKSKYLKSAPNVIASVQVVMCPHGMMIASGIEKDCYFYFYRDNSPDSFGCILIRGHWCKNGTSDDPEHKNTIKTDGSDSDIEITEVRPAPFSSKGVKRAPNSRELLTFPSLGVGPSSLNEERRPVFPPVKVKREQLWEEEIEKRKNKEQKTRSKVRSKHVQRDSKENIRRIPIPNTAPTPAPVSGGVPVVAPAIVSLATPTANPRASSDAPVVAPVADPDFAPFPAQIVAPAPGPQTKSNSKGNSNTSRRSRDSNKGMDEVNSRFDIKSQSRSHSGDKYENRHHKRNKTSEVSSGGIEKTSDMRGIQISVAKVKKEKSNSPGSSNISASQKAPRNESDFFKISQKAENHQKGDSRTINSHRSKQINDKNGPEAGSGNPSLNLNLAL